ncbi:MAG TPA: signal recognition particle protein [Spirochaetia bacterium]|nr:signal recognition particle protein [Spirochaetia bacterium]HTZ53323.1 signal recognition particle protein [Spirochaetia bacterium]
MLDRLSGKLGDLIRQVSGKAHISEKNIQDAINEIKIALLEADVNLRVVRRFVNQATEEALGEKVLRSVSPGQQFVKLLYDKMVGLLGGELQGLALKGPDTQSVILLAGLQGSGKTTTAAKLAMHLKQKGRRPLLAAADLVRPAAVEQLAVLGEKAGVEVHREDVKDPVRVVQGALARARREQFDVVIVDTSGRLQVDDALMAELVRVRDAAQPVETLLVADAMTGQNAVDIAKEFDARVSLTGVILTKFDSDTRGGAALSVKSITGKPIKFVGVGEKLDGLEAFHPERVASRILGMGDVVSLVEKAQAVMEQGEAERLQEKLAAETFTLEDMLDQYRRMRKMGSVQSLVEMIPGLKGSGAEDKIDEAGMRREEAIILSMTPSERKNYRIVGPSRRARVARGAGTSVFEVNRFLKKFEKTCLMMKKMSRNTKYQAQVLSQLGAQGGRQ